jgi:thioesterase domain-containing protein
VIQRNSMEYTKPVLDQFQATCILDSEARWNGLIKSLERKAIGRIQLTSQFACGNELAGQFEGSFVISDMTP